MPGGAPSAFNFSIKASHSGGQGQGSTLPGSKPGNALLDGQKDFVPYITEEDGEEEELPSLPPRQSSIVGHHDSHRPPMPTPRNSVLNRKESDEQPDSMNDSNLTFVTELADQSSLINRTLSPSPMEEKQGSSTSIDNQTDEARHNGSLNVTSQTLSSVDTPLKASFQGRLESSALDTPEREVLAKQDD